MRVRLLAAWCVVASGQAAWAGSFDQRGMWQFDPRAVFTESFEDAASLVGNNVQLYTRRYDAVPSDETSLYTYLTLSDGTALEGEGYFQSARGRTAPANLFMSVPAMDGRIDVRLWTRAQPGTVSITLNYGEPTDHGYTFATLTANPTGRRTSDEWVELSSGPVDSIAWGQRLQTVQISAGFSDFVVDALEILKLGPRMFRDEQTCLPATTETSCGHHGECIFGACLDSALVWGAVPHTRQHRDEYAARLAHIFRRFHGNREAVTNRGESFERTLMTLAESDSPRIFYSGITRAVHDFRDQHTSGPTNFSAFYGSLPSTAGSEQSGALGACFGVTKLDLRGGALGFTVFRTDGLGGEVGTPLQVGDILTSVDGAPVDQWLRQLPSWSSNAASDPRSDPSWLAVELSGALTTRARSFNVLRCESSTSCSNPTTVTVNVADTLRAKIISAGHLYNLDRPFFCDGRFSNSVTALAPPSQEGYDVVSYERREGVATFQFDGFSGDDAWDAAFANGLADRPPMALFDTRLGNGGSVSSAQFLLSALRDDTSPLTGLAINRTWDRLDYDGFVDGLLFCIESTPGFFYDACTGTITFKTNSPEASGRSTKVAWLNTADVSANDFVPRLLQGRPNLRIFGPTPTSGAFGAVVGLPPLMPGEYSGGSIQIHDTRFASSSAGLLEVPFESGTGVSPDEVLVQTLSDALQGRDTMLARALAWLRETP